jgi:3-oxoadipate enol-lactonase
MEANFESDVSGLAPRVRAPTLVVAGDADRTVDLAWSRELAALIPGTRFEVLAGANHIGASGGDPRVKQLILEFLSTDGG